MNRIKVLILCYDYEPLNTVAVHRVSEWAQNLNEFGVYPIIVTRKWNNEIKNHRDYYVNEDGELETIVLENCTEVRIPNRLTRIERLNARLTELNWIKIRKITTFFTILTRFIPGVNIEKNIYKRNFKLLQNTFKPDLIITTGEPFVLFKYAYQYHKKFGTPYFLDYRDGWSTNVFKQSGLTYYLTKIEAFFEKKYLKSAKHVVIASEFLLTEIADRFNFHNISVIENGADLKSIQEVTPIPDSFFSIVFSGTIYEKHNVHDFLLAFEKLIKDKKAVVKFIGADYYTRHKNVLEIKEFAEKYPENVFITSRIPKKDAIQLQKNATILLKFSSGAVTKGFYGAKLYEYACMNKPILNVVATEAHAHTDFFEKEEIQTFAYSAETCYTKLNEFYKQWENNCLKSTFLNEDQLNSISRKKQTEKLALKIHELLKT